MKNRSDRIAQLVYDSCVQEIKAFKPGNVSVYSEGHGMEVDDFIRSAELISPVMADDQLSVAEKVLESVRLTMSQVGCNTNLGIILLLAPLSSAFYQTENKHSYTKTLNTLLHGLTVEDASLVFQAIELASPGGLGEASDQDVHSSPRVTLLEAMRLAEHRDKIAWQYTHQFEDIFAWGVPNLINYENSWSDEDDLMQWKTINCYLNFMSKFPDSHIFRKFGEEIAERIRKRTELVETRFKECNNSVIALHELRQYDEELKREGINPGTSADLTVASLFVYQSQTLLD